MNRTQNNLCSLAGTSFTKACVRYGCSQMRPVVISHWKQQTSAGLPA